MDGGLQLRLSLLRGESASPMDMADFGRLSSIDLRTHVKPALSDRLAVAMLDMIASGRLPPGSRLPPERRIAEAVPASRVCVRAALERLKLGGYVESVRGSGTRVVPAARSAGVAELIRANEENRRDLRAFLAFLGRCVIERIALIPESEAIEALAAAVEGDRPSADAHDLAEHASRLRQRLAGASGSPIYRLLAEQLDRGMRSLFGHLYRELDDEGRRAIAGSSAALGDALRRRDFEAALAILDPRGGAAGMVRVPDAVVTYGWVAPKTLFPVGRGRVGEADRVRGSDLSGERSAPSPYPLPTGERAPARAIELDCDRPVPGETAPCFETAVLRGLAIAGPEHLGRRLAREIAGMIATGRGYDGDRLPSERRLAELFGVSRASIREALAELKADGMLTSEERCGTRILDRRARLAAFAASDLDHLKTMARLRGYLEVWAARRAAIHAGESDLADLRRIMTELSRPHLSPRRRIDLDVRLHLTISRAAGCAVQLYVTEVLRDVMMAYFDLSITVFDEGPERDAMLFEHHTAIVNAIIARDPSAAERAMATHVGAFSNRYELVG